MMRFIVFSIVGSVLGFAGILSVSAMLGNSDLSQLWIGLAFFCSVGILCSGVDGFLASRAPLLIRWPVTAAFGAACIAGIMAFGNTSVAGVLRAMLVSAFAMGVCSWLASKSATA